MQRTHRHTSHRNGCGSLRQLEAGSKQSARKEAVQRAHRCSYQHMISERNVSVTSDGFRSFVFTPLFNIYKKKKKKLRSPQARPPHVSPHTTCAVCMLDALGARSALDKPSVKRRGFCQWCEQTSGLIFPLLVYGVGNSEIVLHASL